MEQDFIRADKEYRKKFVRWFICNLSIMYSDRSSADPAGPSLDPGISRELGLQYCLSGDQSYYSCPFLERSSIRRVLARALPRYQTILPRQMK